MQDNRRNTTPAYTAEVKFIVNQPLDKFLGVTLETVADLFYVTPTFPDNDSDGISDANDPDDDNDLMPDTWEIQFGLNPFSNADAALDTDGDNITNLNEYLQGTNPLIPNNNTPVIIPIILDYLLDD